MVKPYILLAFLAINFLSHANAQPGEPCLKGFNTCIGPDLVCAGLDPLNGTCLCPAANPNWNPRLFRCLTSKIEYDIISTVPSQFGDRGEWGQNVYCEVGSYVVGFRTKMDLSPPDGDDTSMNSVELICSTKTRIRSSEGHIGVWGADSYCPNNTRANGFSYRIETPISGDNTAMNTIRMQCENGATITATEGWWGNWGGPVSCPTGFYICGLQTQVQPFQGNGDDTSLNNVKIFCCKYA